MANFPLRFIPKESWHERPRAFGSPRDHGQRIHAGCDLYAPIGTEILAIDDGIVLAHPYSFYLGTYALEVNHPQGVIRYGEIQSAAEGIAAGVHVKAGQVIAKVGQLEGLTISMIHFELYAGTATGRLTQFGRSGYERREDLKDPTELLDSLPLLN